MSTTIIQGILWGEQLKSQNLKCTFVLFQLLQIKRSTALKIIHKAKVQSYSNILQTKGTKMYKHATEEKYKAM